MEVAPRPKNGRLEKKTVLDMDSQKVKNAILVLAFSKWDILSCLIAHFVNFGPTDDISFGAYS